MQMFKTVGVTAVTALCCGGCTFDATGGSGASAGVAGATGPSLGTGATDTNNPVASSGPVLTSGLDGTTTTSATPSTDGRGSGGMTTTGPTSGTTGADSDADSSGGPPPVDCDSPYSLVLSVTAAQLVPPMGVVNELGQPLHLTSVTDEGAAVFSFTPECDGTYQVLANARDAWPGVNDFDPDSWVVDSPADDGLWFLGCQTLDDLWAIFPVLLHESLGLVCADAVPLTLELTAGTPYTIRFRNREPQNMQQGLVAQLGDVVLEKLP